MTIEIKALNLGLAATNCYIVADTATRHALVIDPVDDAPLILETVAAAGWTVKLILATHGHFDHVLASKPLKDLTAAPFYIHENGPYWLDSLPEQGMMFTGQPFPPAATPDRLLTSQSEVLELDSIRLETIYTPGHAHDHIAYYLAGHKLLFGGDCLFAGSIGRTDLPFGDYAILMQSIFEKILPLGDEVRILPGHMQPTTIERERTTNPYLLEYARNHP